MPRNTIQDLQNITDQFFKLHLKDTKPPTWSEPWDFMGSIPKHNYPGCYATFNEKKEITYIYIGLGIGSAKGRYQEHGLGKRLKQFYKVDVRDYKDASKTTYRRVDKINAYYLSTLPFEKDYFYLAAAFEVYAILNLENLHNTAHNRS